VDGGEDGVPGLDEVATARVAEDAEGRVGGESGEDVADELVAEDGTVGAAGETGEVEDGFEVAVTFDEAGWGGLEVGFGEFGFDEEVVELEVDLGAVEFSSDEWDAGGDAEAGLGGELGVEEIDYGGGEGGAVVDAGVAEDVHEEGVGADGGVELHPLPVFAGSGAAGGGVDFSEAAEPVGVGADAGVRCVVEVAVATLVVAAEDDGGGSAGGDVVEELLGAGEVVGAEAEVAAKHGGGPGWSGDGHESARCWMRAKVATCIEPTGVPYMPCRSRLGFAECLLQLLGIGSPQATSWFPVLDSLRQRSSPGILFCSHAFSLGLS
jgi:hypothetical protein